MKEIIYKNKIKSQTLSILNETTGELKEIGSNMELIEYKNSGLIGVNSNNYVTLDSDALNEITSTYGNEPNFIKDLGILFLLSTYLKFKTNCLVLDNDKALTPSTFSKCSNQKQRGIKETFNRLIRYGIMMRQVNMDKKVKGKYIYAVNPSFLRIGKQFYFDNVCCFRDFTEKKKTNKSIRPNINFDKQAS